LIGLRETTRAQAARTLWPEVAEKYARASLRTTIWQVRQRDPRLIASRGDELALAPGTYLDVTDLVRRAARRDELSSPEFLRLLQMGDLLPGWSEAWVRDERDRIRHLRQHALEDAGWSLLRSGRSREAYEVGLAAVRDRPLCEGPHRLLIGACLEEGDWSEALRLFDRYRDMLSRRLGLAPSEELQRLVEPLLLRNTEPVAADNAMTGPVVA
jgi:pentatricopeptide repeat protein